MSTTNHASVTAEAAASPPRVSADARASQRITALARANEIRLRRSSLKDSIRAGQLTIAEVLDDPAVQTATVFDLLRAPRRMGPGKARIVLRMIGASATLQVAQLTDRQRQELLNILSAAGH